MSDEEISVLFANLAEQSDAMRVLLDGNINQHVLPLLKDAGIESTSIRHIGMTDEQSEFRILAKAGTMGSIVVSADKDFREVHKRIQSLGIEHAGIIFVKTNTAKNDHAILAQRIIKHSELYQTNPKALWNTLHAV